MNKIKILSIIGVILSIAIVLCGFHALIQLSKTDFTSTESTSPDIQDDKVDIEDENTVKKLNFAVHGNKLLGYTGTELTETFEIPASYSLSNTRTVEYSFDNEAGLDEFLVDIEEMYPNAETDEELFDYVFYEASGHGHRCTTIDSLHNLKQNLAHITAVSSRQVYPITTQVIENDIIEGNDFQITEIQNFRFYNLPEETYKLEVLFDKVKTIKLPATITSVDDFLVFHKNFDNLENFLVDNENSKYKSVFGCVLDKESGQLLFFPAGKTGTFYLSNEVMALPTNTVAPENDYHRAFMFSNCKLDKLILNSNITTIPEYCFSTAQIGEIVLSDSVTSIEDGAFCMSSITQMDIPSSVSKIGAGAFYSCDNLTRMVIPETVSTIDDFCLFRHSSNLVEVIINAPITDIAYTFEGCSSLRTVSLPSTLTRIGAWAFIHCSSLANIEIPNTVTEISLCAFQNSGLTSINIPNSVTILDGAAFAGCSNLTNVTIGTGITNIPSNVFAQCPALENVTLLGTNITAIDKAFGNSSLFTLTIHTPIPPTLVTNNPLNISTLYVPAGCVEAYESAWRSKLSDGTVIQEIPAE